MQRSQSTAFRLAARRRSCCASVAAHAASPAAAQGTEIGEASVGTRHARSGSAVACPSSREPDMIRETTGPTSGG